LGNPVPRSHGSCGRISGPAPRPPLLTPSQTPSPPSARAAARAPSASAAPPPLPGRTPGNLGQGLAWARDGAGGLGVSERRSQSGAAPAARCAARSQGRRGRRRGREAGRVAWGVGGGGAAAGRREAVVCGAERPTGRAQRRAASRHAARSSSVGVRLSAQMTAPGPARTGRKLLEAPAAGLRRGRCMLLRRRRSGGASAQLAARGRATQLTLQPRLQTSSTCVSALHDNRASQRAPRDEKRRSAVSE
jgi:hypothetical protein